jgi:hypothetical protein
MPDQRATDRQPHFPAMLLSTLKEAPGATLWERFTLAAAKAEQPKVRLPEK